MSSERQISVESLVAAYRDELATLNQRVVEQTAYARSLETAYADVLEKLRKYEQPEQQEAAPEVDGEAPAEGKASQNGRGKASTRR